MTTADLHPKRFSLSMTVGQLRRLSDELSAMGHAPHDLPIPADTHIEWDRAGEQLWTHVAMLVADTRDSEEDARLEDTLSLLRMSAKYLLTACDRCRRHALRAGVEALPGGHAAAMSDVKTWDDTMRRLSEQHGVISPLRNLVEPFFISTEKLGQLGLSRESLFNGDQLVQ